MNFLAPIAFLFGLTIPVVVLFYLLKRRRVVKLVASTLLWQKFLAETQASAPFQKLRKNWLLFLQVLLLLLAVLALARPYFSSRTHPARLRVVILDSSASMQATDEKPSRFEKARAEALTWVDSLHDADKMVVLLAGANTEVVQSATSDKTALRRAINSCVCSDGPTSLSLALKMAESLVRPYVDKKEAEVHLFSDGAVPDLSEFENKGLPLVFHPVGKDANNLGITALDVRANPEDPHQRAIYANVVNVSSNTLSTSVEISFDDQQLESRPLQVPPGESSPQVFLADQPHDGVFTVRLTAQDDLAADNQASIVSILPQPVKVLLVTAGNRRLEKGLRSVANLELAVRSSLADSATEYDFVVLDNVTPAVWPTVNVMAIHVVNPAWFETVTNVAYPMLLPDVSSHPLLRSLSFDNVRVDSSFAVKPPPWAVGLLECQEASVIVAGDLGRQRIVWFGFNIYDTDWPLRMSFPMFFVNAAEWLNPSNLRNSQLLVKAGEPFRQASSQPVDSAQVVSPDGATRTLTVNTNTSEVVFGSTFRQGIYHLHLGTNDAVFCVDLLDAAESNIRPHTDIKVGTYAVSATSLQRANTELWRNLAAIAFIVLLVEWWYYHRRTV